MRILWVTNSLLPRAAALFGKPVPEGCSWTASLFTDLMQDETNEMLAFCLSGGYAEASEPRFQVKTFPQKMWEYSSENERRFAEAIAAFCPDVIHIFGTEFPHTLEMLNAAKQKNMLDHTLVSIQGLCSVIAGHYLQGLPPKTWKKQTLRDFLRGDSIEKQRRALVARGAFERESLLLARHVAGRTDWDKACTEQVNPALCYHKLNEGMRGAFYENCWRVEGCNRRTLFLPQGNYPVKGMHFALEALAVLRKEFPDVRLATTGQDPRNAGLRRTYYQKYLAERIAALDLSGNVSYLGMLDADRMCDAFLSANAAISASTIENSPNGVAEAMLVGVPTVSSMVGGVASMLTHGEDGFLYQADAPYMLAAYVSRIFNDDALAKRLSESARAHAAKTHDRAAILAQLTEIYGKIAGGAA